MNGHSSVRGAMSASPQSSSYERRRVVETERRIVDGAGTRGDAPTPLARDGVINTAYIERLNATFREHLAPLAAPLSGAGSPHPDAARGHVLGRHGL